MVKLWLKHFRRSQRKRSGLKSMIAIILKSLLDYRTQRNLTGKKIFYEKKLELAVKFYESIFVAYHELSNQLSPSSLGIVVPTKILNEELDPKLFNLLSLATQLRLLSTPKEYDIIEQAVNNLLALNERLNDDRSIPSKHKNITHQNEVSRYSRDILESNKMLLDKYRKSIKRNYRA